MPFVGELRAFGLGKEVTLGTPVAPSIFLPIILPETVSPAIALLSSVGIRQQAENPVKILQGAGTVKGLKYKMETEPENIGQMLQAAFGLDTLSGTTLLGFTHNFIRQNVSSLPSYTLWIDKGASPAVFAEAPGALLSKLSFEIKNKEYIMLDAEWESLTFDTAGATQTVSYSSVNPFRWFQSVVTVGGSVINNYDTIKIEIDNKVSSQHTLRSGIYPSKIYSAGMEVKGNMDIVVEDTVEWAKFLAGTQTSLNITLTHSDNIPGTSPLTPYTLAFDLPTINYATGPYQVNKGLIKIPFTFMSKRLIGNTYGLQVTVKNGVSTAY